MAGLDFSNLTATDTDAIPATRRSDTLKDTPFPGWIADSYERKVGKSVTVPADHVGQVRGLIRKAAASAGLGVRIALSEAKTGNPLDWYSKNREAFVVRPAEGDEVTKVPGNLNVAVKFQAQDKRKYEKRQVVVESEEYEGDDYDESDEYDEGDE